MRPQTFVTTSTESAPPVAGGGWGTLFIAAPALKGETGKAHRVRSLRDHDRIFGGRAAYSQLRDQLETFFAEGGSDAYVARVTHASSVKASASILDAAPAEVLKLSAKSVGAWANGFKIVVSNVSGSGLAALADYSLQNADSQELVFLEQVTVAEAAVADLGDFELELGVGTGTVAAATYTLSGGNDAHASITTSEYEDALELFLVQLGTGLVVTPMLDIASAGSILEAHAVAYNRAWLSHSSDVANVATIAGQGVAARAAGRIHGAIIAANIRIPALPENPTVERVIAPEGAVAGRIAKTDALGSPARAAAGTVNGAFSYASSCTQSFTDAELDILHDSGVNVVRDVRGTFCLYDYITPAKQSGLDKSWLNFGHVRAHAAICAACDEIAERFQFSLIDGGASVFGEFSSALNAMLLGFYKSNTLNGASNEDAYRVSLADNTPETIAANELYASVRVKYSETNYWTHINITKVPTTGTV